MELMQQEFSSRNLVFAMSAVALAGKLAAVDGRPNVMEINAFEQLFQVNALERKTMLKLFFAGADDDAPIESYTGFIAKCFPESPGIIADLLEKLINLADSDAFIKPQEYAFLSLCCELLKFPTQTLDDIISNYYLENQDKPAKLLRLSKRNSKAAREAYLALSREIHPDVYDNGEVEFLKNLSSQRFSLVAQAYEKLR